MFVFGWGTDSKVLGESAYITCEHCQNEAVWQVVEVSKKATAYLIPVAKWAKRYYHICPVCHDGYELRSLEAAQDVLLHGREQRESLKTLSKLIHESGEADLISPPISPTQKPASPPLKPAPLLTQSPQPTMQKPKPIDLYLPVNQQYFYLTTDGETFGPYSVSEFLHLLSEGRIKKDFEFATTPNGPWRTLSQLLQFGPNDAFFYKDGNGKSVGPASNQYLMILAESNEVSANTPISKSSQGPWKHYSEAIKTFVREWQTLPVATGNKFYLRLTIVLISAWIATTVFSLFLATSGKLPEDKIAKFIPLSIILNPLLWLGLAIYIFIYIDSKVCPKCGKPLKNLNRIHIYSCDRCQAKIRSM